MNTPLPAAPDDTAPRGPAGWSIVLPYFNEEDFLPATLATLLAQHFRPFVLILVDNGSTDRSTDICRGLLRDTPGVTAVYLQEPRAGKTNALECGLAHVTTPFVTFCDADTYYPPHYLARADELFAASSSKVVAVMAVHQWSGCSPFRTFLRQAKVVLRSHIYTRQCLTGGFAQSFRTAALRAAGGFSTRIWPFVFEDHEVMQRVFKHGSSRYAFDHWCIPSMRRTDRSRVDWTYWERRLYGILPFAFKDWYFYTYLARKFTQRGLFQVRLREKNWNAPENLTPKQPAFAEPLPSAVAADTP